VVKGVRLDKGFFDEKNFICFEDNCIEYVCKAKLTANVRKIIAYLDEQDHGGNWTTPTPCRIDSPLPHGREPEVCFYREKVKPIPVPTKFLLISRICTTTSYVTNMEDLPLREFGAGTTNGATWKTKSMN
jgi:hypothetical protein